MNLGHEQNLANLIERVNSLMAPAVLTINGLSIKREHGQAL